MEKHRHCIAAAKLNDDHRQQMINWLARNSKLLETFVTGNPKRQPTICLCQQYRMMIAAAGFC